MNFRFQYYYYIWLLAAVLVFLLLFLLLLQWKKKVRTKMGDAKLVAVLTQSFSPVLFTSKFILLSLGFAVGVIAAMNPRKSGDADSVTRKGIDVVVAMDVSKSMLAADLAPNRLERAKQFVNKLMNEMPDDRIALVLFAGKAYIQMPLTTDHGAAQFFVSSATPDAVPQQGTLISDALTMSVNAFNIKERRFKAIVLISDGEEHDAQAIATAEKLAEQGVLINTVGVGSPEGSTITDPATGQNKLDEAGNVVLSKLNEEVLKQVAATTNGVYVRLQSSDDAVKEIKAQLGQIERKAFSDISLVNYKTLFMWFAGAMFLLLLVEHFIPEAKRIKA
ncbi:MAG: VWA domain-containing protein [Chitinophagales bacterium]|nr:VWA domain-containing protein [Chitinophagales bacterium]